MRKLLLAISLTAILLAGCARQKVSPVPAPPDEGWDRPLSVAMQNWIENSKTMFVAQYRRADGFLYLLVTYGKKRTGGYRVEITEVTVTSGKISVEVVFKRPGPGEIVTQAITYPYDLKILEAPNLPVEFLPLGCLLYTSPSPRDS